MQIRSGFKFVIFTTNIAEWMEEHHLPR